MHYLQPVLTYLSALSGLDNMDVEAVLISTLVLALGLGRKLAGMVIAGKHLPVGDMANDLLWILNNDNYWSVSANRTDDNNLCGPNGMYIDLAAYHIFTPVGKVDYLLNRKERRLIFAKATKLFNTLVVKREQAKRMLAENAVREAKKSLPT